MYSIEQLLEAYKKNNYKYFLDSKFDCNLFGVRSSSRKAGEFDDIVGVFYKDYNDRDKVWCSSWPSIISCNSTTINPEE